MHQKKLFLTHYNHHALALIHALTNALIHALTHALIHALTHALTHALALMITIKMMTTKMLTKILDKIKDNLQVLDLAIDSTPKTKVSIFKTQILKLTKKWKLKLQSKTRSNNNQKITLNKEDETLVDILETYDSVNSEKTSLPYTLNLIFYIILFCY